MKKYKINTKLLFYLPLFLILSGCSNPLTEEEKKAVVKTLINEPMPTGEYVVFWDGTNDKNQTVSAGTYYARLYSRQFTFQIKMTALEGGTGVSNDSSYSFPGFQPMTVLEQNHPDPFRIKDGTNIPFTLSDSSTVQLTIRNKE